MDRNAIKSEFPTSKMADRSEMAKIAIESEFQTSISHLPRMCVPVEKD